MRDPTVLVPRLNAEVELTAERARHIEQKHADLWREHRDKIAEVLAVH